MACLIKDLRTNNWVGYRILTQEEKANIKKGGELDAIFFYNEATCRKVLGLKESEV